MATRLILDEFDLDLATLTARLVVLVFIFVASTHARAFGAAVLQGAVTGSGSGSSQLILGRSGLLVCDISDVGHGEQRVEGSDDEGDDIKFTVKSRDSR